MSADQLIAVLVAVAGMVVALWLLTTRAERQPRALAAIGAVFIVFGTIARFAYQWLSSYLGVADTDTIVTAMAVATLAAGVLTGVGMLLLARAVVVAR